MRLLLDTNVVSEIVAKRPNNKVVEWFGGLDSDQTWISVFTVGEIRKGIEKMPASKRRTQLFLWLSDELLNRFQGKVLEFGATTAVIWGELTGRLELSGKRMTAIDSLIGSQVLEHQLILATGNTRDFEPFGIPTVNPWA